MAGGVFVIDDFGRQREQPQALINRWIIPLERGIDYLTLQTGRKFEAPFDTLVIFSTNIPPRQLVDEAALRRIRHKIEIGRPDRDAFIRILIDACRGRKIAIDEETIAYMLGELYEAKKADYAAFHPEFLIDQVLAIAAYEWQAALVLIIVAAFFLPIFLKKQIFTMPQFCEQRFEKRVGTSLAVFWLLVYVFVNPRPYLGFIIAV